MNKVLVMVSNRGSLSESDISEPYPLALVESSVVACLVIDRNERKYLTSVVSSILSIRAEFFSFLIAPKAPPKFSARSDPPITSFACSAGVWNTLVSEEGLGRPTSGLYSLFSLLLAIRPNTALLAFQLDRVIEVPRAAELTPGAIDVVMAHRGDSRLLGQSLRSLHQSPSGCITRIAVGLDERLSSEVEKYMLEFRSVRFYQSSTLGMGPYLIRNELCKVATGDAICFHDSDDLSCWNRVSELFGELKRHGPGMVGSHEVRIDDITQSIYPVRYPLNVEAALAEGPAYVQLHPASMISRHEFLASGGFSTEAPFSMDRHFLYRSYFLFRSWNIDSFLYVRRRHHRSLTNMAETSLESLRRLRLRDSWTRDFHRVRFGEVSLDSSSLAIADGDSPDYSLRELNQSARYTCDTA